MKKYVQGNADQTICDYMNRKGLGNFGFFSDKAYYMDNNDHIEYDDWRSRDGIEISIEEFKQEIGMIPKELNIFN